MIKTFKKAIAIMLTLVFVLSLVPVGVMANAEGSEPVKVDFINRFWYGTDGTHKSSAKYKGNTYIRAGGIYGGTFQIDFSGYEYLLWDESTTLTASFGGSQSSARNGNWVVYVLNDNADAYSCDPKYGSDALTYNDVSDYMPRLTADQKEGLTPFVINPNQVETNPYSSDANKQVVLDALTASTDDSLVTFEVAQYTGAYSSGKVGFNISHANTYLQINGGENATPENYVDDVAEKLTWDILSDDEIDSAANDLNLPSKFYGANVTWKSSNPNIITDDGKVIGGKGTVETVTLTATLSYKGFEEGAKIVTATKPFVITCQPEEPLTLRIPFTNYAYSRNTSDGKSHEYGHYTFNGYDCIRSAGSFFGYAQLDLSGYEEIINNANTTAVVSLECGLQFGTARMDGVTGHIAPDTADNYDNEKITWYIAEELGLHNTEDTPVLFETDCVDFIPGEVDSAAANIATLRTAIDEGTNSLVSLYFAPAKSGNDSSMRISSENSGLFITYYESEIDDEDYLDSIKSSFIWENITSDAADLVVNNLPIYYKGAKVVWSSGEEVITSSGELTPVAGQIIDATLKATVTYGDYSFEKSFDVKVSDNGITLSEPVLTSENGVATASFSVSNRTAEDVTYKLYLATYKDKELMEVKPFEFTINKGTEMATNDLAANLGDGYTAKFFVWDADGITPVVKNK